MCIHLFFTFVAFVAVTLLGCSIYITYLLTIIDGPYVLNTCKHFILYIELVYILCGCDYMGFLGGKASLGPSFSCNFCSIYIGSHVELGSVQYVLITRPHLHFLRDSISY